MDCSLDMFDSDLQRLDTILDKYLDYVSRDCAGWYYLQEKEEVELLRSKIKIK